MDIKLTDKIQFTEFQYDHKNGYGTNKIVEGIIVSQPLIYYKVLVGNKFKEVLASQIKKTK